MDRKIYLVIGGIFILLGGLAFGFILKEQKPEPIIVGFGFTDGDCNKKGSIFMSNESIRNSVETIEENAKEKARCFSDEKRYAFTVPLPSGTFWCIDSSGFSGEISHKIENPSCAN
jgi:hypothetical protein